MRFLLAYRAVVYRDAMLEQLRPVGVVHKFTSKTIFLRATTGRAATRHADPRWFRCPFAETAELSEGKYVGGGFLQTHI